MQRAVNTTIKEEAFSMLFTYIHCWATDVFYGSAVVKLTTAQVTKLPLQHKIREIGMLCSVKPVLTEDLCVVQREEFFSNML
jgi:hypothetical protein